MPLTPRELQVLQALADGKSPKEICFMFCIHRSTVFFHIRRIKEKLNAVSREEAVAHGCFIGLVKPIMEHFPSPN
jgi:DNA-binding CsgD family transcriptional regulator